MDWTTDALFFVPCRPPPTSASHALTCRILPPHQIMAISTLVTTVAFFLPLAVGECRPVPTDLEGWSPAGVESLKRLVTLNCRHGEFNEVQHHRSRVTFTSADVEPNRNNNISPMTRPAVFRFSLVYRMSRSKPQSSRVDGR